MNSKAPLRTSYNGPPLSGTLYSILFLLPQLMISIGPGIIYTTSKIIQPKVLPDEKFNWWYENIHIPDMLASGVVSAAWRFKNLNPKSEIPYLAVYKIPDMAALQTPAFKSVRQAHESLPDGGPAHRYVNFDTRYYQLIQIFETEENSMGMYKPRTLETLRSC